MEKVKKVVTLLGKRTTENISISQTNQQPGSEWMSLFARKNPTGNLSQGTKHPFEKEQIFIRHLFNEDVLHFNLPEVTSTLVTVYDLAGKIISIQTCMAHCNSLLLDVQNHNGNYIVRVQLNYTQCRYAN
jgi:hypothetical protein